MAMGFSAMFTFQLNNTRRQTLPAPHCRNGSCRYVLALYRNSPSIYGSGSINKNFLSQNWFWGVEWKSNNFLKKKSWIMKFWWFGCHDWVRISFFISEVETREPHRIFSQHQCNNNYRQLLLLLCLTRNGHPDPFQPFLGF